VILPYMSVEFLLSSIHGVRGPFAITGKNLITLSYFSTPYTLSPLYGNNPGNENVYFVAYRQQMCATIHPFDFLPRRTHHLLANRLKRLANFLVALLLCLVYCRLPYCLVGFDHSRLGLSGCCSSFSNSNEEACMCLSFYGIALPKKFSLLLTTGFCIRSDYFIQSLHPQQLPLWLDVEGHSVPRLHLLFLESFS
jgi:hypothetical protein